MRRTVLSDWLDVTIGDMSDSMNYQQHSHAHDVLHALEQEETKLYEERGKAIREWNAIEGDKHALEVALTQIDKKLGLVETEGHRIKWHLKGEPLVDNGPLQFRMPKCFAAGEEPKNPEELYKGIAG